MSRKYKSLRKLNIISYNLHYHRANLELAGLVERYNADLLCLQECYSEQLPRTISNLVLADKTTSGRLNLAIYYNPDRLDCLKTESHELKNSLVEKLLIMQTERLLVTRLYDKLSNQPLSLGSFHATHLIASNYLRRAQIRTAHDKLSQLVGSSPAIMVGDYNYPLFKRGLKVCIEETGYKMTLSDRPTYYLTKLIRAHFDLATSINTQIERVLTLPKGISDHAPILIQAAI